MFTSYGVDGGRTPFYWLARCEDGSWDTVATDADDHYWGGECGCDTREEAREEAKRKETKRIEGVIRNLK